MQLSLTQQITEYVNRSQKILIALPTHVTIDRLCSGVALRLALEQFGKQVVLACAAPALPQLEFLSESPAVEPVLSGQAGLVVNLSTAHAQLDELSYQTDERGVRIFLKPKNGEFSPEDISVKAISQQFDLIITLGAQGLEQIGELFTQNTELFFQVPKINLDTDPSNEYFGAINLVDVTAAALSELVTRIVETLALPADERIVTCLLAGIIANTHSFQDPTTTPSTLATASTLIAQGARQQDIIKSLYKTREFSLLKLWGRALARIQTVPEVSLLYSQLNKSDFDKTNETPNRLMAVLKELLENVSGYQVIALMGEIENGTRMLIAALPHVGLNNITHKLTNSNVPSIPLFGPYDVATVELPGVDLNVAEERLKQAVV